MKINLEVKGMPKESQMEAAALTTSRCTEFFIGWIQRFRDTLKLFVFPSNNKDHPNL